MLRRKTIHPKMNGNIFCKIFGFLQTLPEPVFVIAESIAQWDLRKVGVWMMAINSFRQLSVLVLAGFALTACGGDSVSPEEMMRVAEKFKIRDSEKAAFKACVANSEGSSPYVKFGAKIMQLESVPVEVCGCQTKSIAQSFKKEKLAAYATFLTWATKPGRKGSPRFDKADLAQDANTKKVRDRLIETLDSCSLMFAKANGELANTLLTPYIDPAQLKKEAAEKKKKDAEAKAKAEAAKKSET
jgi:hypothetical protein